MQAAYYQAAIPEFVQADEAAVLGQLAAAHGFALEHEQKGAWQTQITVLKPILAELPSGHVLFEFAIPRMGKRADVVIVLGGILFVLEFKVGAPRFDRAAIEQAFDYALDLKNFHRGSHSLPIVPMVVATGAKAGQGAPIVWASDGVAEPVLTAICEISPILKQCLAERPSADVNFEGWITSGYQPTPTIVEAAQALYQDHRVEEISRSDAGSQNLGVSASCISEVIEHSKAHQRKSICFVTGVPGAGKTLAGLNIATKRAQEHSDEHAVFLSGNGPLVTVLREALARDEAERAKTSKAAAYRKVSSFIQNIHHFRDEALRDPAPPYERVVVFDEAQRAWTREQASNFMRAKRQMPDFDMSEPEFLIGVMDRHPDWCVIVGLIGGGQEINTGEAGLVEWLAALRDSFPDWDIYISDRLADSDYTSDPTAADMLGDLHVQVRNELHLAVSMRSFRAEALSAFINHLVENRPKEARAIYGQIAERYPIAVTRDLSRARRWLKARARGSERYGLLASSGALRLRPEGLHVKAKIDPAVWFLNERDDVRSSFYCEEPATEFDVQGLELDWAGVCWDGDYRYASGEWTTHKFRGTRWQRANASESQLYLKNAYRVLLTRARQGMVIYVPTGSDEDPTRPPSYYAGTFEYLLECGLPCLETAETTHALVGSGQTD